MWQATRHERPAPRSPRRRPRQIILVRHGESEGNVDDSVYAHKPNYALELTEKGVEQARDAGRQIAELIQPEPGTATSVRFYVSTYTRTRQTYETIRAVVQEREGITLQPTYFDPRLREQDWGHLREAAATEAIEKERDEYGAFHYRFPDGESCADVYDRLSLVLDTMHRDWEELTPEKVVVVTHGMTMRVFVMRIFNHPPEEFEHWRNPKNCGIVVLDQRPDGKFTQRSPFDRYPERPATPSTVIEVELTDAMIKNGYLDFPISARSSFPGNALGIRSADDHGVPVELHFGGRTVHSDIRLKSGAALSPRARFTRWFRTWQASPGDRIRVSRLDERTYELSYLRNQGKGSGR